MTLPSSGWQDCTLAATVFRMSGQTLLTATVLRLPNGRDLAFREYGDPHGMPVLGFHGTPGSRLQLEPRASSPLPPGYRLIAPDRPGYGHSSYDPNRRLTDWPGDVVALADYLGIDRFGVLGISGGGPHALACAHALGDRLIGVACVSGVGPLYQPDAMEGMLTLNRWLTRLARGSGFLLRLLMRVQFGAARRNPARMLDMLVEQLPSADQAIVAEPEFRAMMMDDLGSNSSTMPIAAAQDFILFASDWGFALEDIRVAVHFFQGSEDRNVPARHAERMAGMVPDGVLHPYPGEGHFLVVPRLAEIMATAFGTG
jgi:pimeloyl-ACP methyl ester carboxylesterase